jgi:hypothetical protein
MKKSDPDATAIHKRTPCKSGRGPTCRMVFIESPVPIR